MNFIENNDQDGFNSYISRDEYFNQSGLSFVANNDQDGFNSYISRDEFFNQRGPMGGGMGGGSVSTGIGTGGGAMGGGSVSTGIGTGGGTPSPNLNVSNGLTAGISSVNAQVLPTTGSPGLPYVPATPGFPGSPAIPSTPSIPAVPSSPAYNPNTSGGMSVGVTNQGTNPNQSCPCEYSMNCWDNNCPSTISTYTGLSSPTCPAGTTQVEPNCMVSATIGSPSVPAQPYVPAVPSVAPTMAQQYVPAVPSTMGTPTSYNVNCWSQTCPSTLSTYGTQASPTCPPSTQFNEPCLDSSSSSAFSGSGFNGGLWF